MRTFSAQEYKVVSIRECPLPETLRQCTEPAQAAAYWREHIVNHPAFSRDVECLVVLLLNTRRRVLGHTLVATGTLDTILAHPREVFRPAISSPPPVRSSSCTITPAARPRLPRVTFE